MLIIIIFFLMLILYGLANYIYVTLPIVEAGPIFGKTHTGLKRGYKNIPHSFTINKSEGKWHYRQFVVQGNCMVPEGISEGDIIRVRMFDSVYQKTELKKNDIALIFLNDQGFRGYKIRLIKSINGDSADTYYFDENGTETPSSKSHSLKDVIGIVDRSSFPN